MAKSKSFFGLRRGSTKSLTFSVLNGQQVTKDRVYGGKNPRSMAQMIQRMCMATSSAAYAAMKQIVDHSFEGTSYGANTMAKFLSINTKALKNAYAESNDDFAYNPYGDRGLKVGPYIMSQGTASDIYVSSITPSKTGTAITFNVITSGVTDPTPKKVIASLGIAVGELCTICFLYAKANTSNDWRFGFIRITALQTGTDPLTSENFKNYFQVESNLGVVSAVPSTEGNQGHVNLGINAADADADINTLPWCAIHSLQSNGVWLRSNTAIDVPQDADVQPSAADALATYPVGESYVLNGGDVE